MTGAIAIAIFAAIIMLIGYWAGQIDKPNIDKLHKTDIKNILNGCTLKCYDLYYTWKDTKQEKLVRTIPQEFEKYIEQLKSLYGINS